MPSANTFVTRALKMLNLFEAAETPPAADLADGLVVLNEMISAWATQRLTMKFTERHVIELDTDIATYAFSIFVGEPDLIEGVSVVADRDADPALEIPIARPLTVAQWQNIPDKTLSGTYPSQVYVDQSGGTAIHTIHVYPVPNQDASDLVLYCPTPVSQFANGSTNYTFAPGYERAIRFNLAVELAANYEGVDPSGVVMKIARDSLDWLKAANLPMVDLTLDAALVGGGAYDIEADR